MRPLRILPFVCGLVALFILFMPAPSMGVEPFDRLIHIDAERFAFKPGLIRVNQGDRVTLELTALDVVHGLYLDSYGISIHADPGQTARIAFVADQSGSFRFRCSVACGDMHPFMIGKLQVGTNWMLWRGIGLAVLAVVSVILVKSPH